jgi:hypothetical protein
MRKNIESTLAIMAGIISAGLIYKLSSEKLKKEKELNRKNDQILKLYNQWMQLKQEGKTVAKYLKELGYNSIAIYGLHYLGQNLLEELNNSDIEVRYAIDRNAENIDTDISVYTMDDELLPVDAVIVTAFYFFDDIEEALSDKVSCEIISFEDILYEMY